MGSTISGRMAPRILIASGNPWAFCMAVERDIVRRHPDAQVDLLNLFELCCRSSPHWRPRARVIETLNRNIQRFVKPAVNGRDITSKIRIRSKVPPLPGSETLSLQKEPARAFRFHSRQYPVYENQLRRIAGGTRWVGYLLVSSEWPFHGYS